MKKWLARWFGFREAHRTEVVAGLTAHTERPTRTVPSWSVQRESRTARKPRSVDEWKQQHERKRA